MKYSNSSFSYADFTSPALFQLIAVLVPYVAFAPPVLGTLNAVTPSIGLMLKPFEHTSNTRTTVPFFSTASPSILKCVSYAYFDAKKQLINVNGSRYTGMLVRPVYSPNEY